MSATREVESIVLSHLKPSTKYGVLVQAKTNAGVGPASVAPLCSTLDEREWPKHIWKITFIVLKVCGFFFFLVSSSHNVHSCSSYVDTWNYTFWPPGNDPHRGACDCCYSVGRQRPHNQGDLRSGCTCFSSGLWGIKMKKENLDYICNVHCFVVCIFSAARPPSGWVEGGQRQHVFSGLDSRVWRWQPHCRFHPGV